MEGDLFAWLNGIAYWHWLALAAMLVAFEITAPGYVFLWVAIAAAITGVVKLFIPVGWEWQLLIFGVLSVGTVLLARRFIKKYSVETDQPSLNRREEQYIGQVYTLESAIENGAGRVKVADSVWRVEGGDLPAGSKVKVVSVNGSSFVVEPV